MSDSQQPGGSGSGTKPSVPPDLWAQAATESGAASAARPKAALEPGWERATLEKLAFAALNEQRSARRWKIFFRLTWLLVAVLVAWAALDQSTSGASKLAPHTAVVDIKGEIAAGAEASGGGAVSLNSGGKVALPVAGTKGGCPPGSWPGTVIGAVAAKVGAAGSPGCEGGAVAPAGLLRHHCWDIWASISSIFFSVPARSSGVVTPLSKKDGRTAGSSRRCPPWVSRWRNLRK